MLKSLSLLFVFFIVQNSFGSELIFNRLNNLYNRDAKKCLIVAKRYIDYIPNNASPYYFAAKIYSDKSKLSKTNRGKYLNVKRALNYASDFDDINNAFIKQTVEWNVFKLELSKTTNDLINSLSDNLEFDLSERLSSSLSSFNHEYETEDITSNEFNGNEITNVYESIHKPKVFFGMPEGDEIISSANLSEEQKLLDLINLERNKLGLVPLVWEEGLANASRYHAYDLGTQNYFNHSTYDRKDGKLVKVGGTFERIKKFYSKSYVNSENIAAGNGSAYDTYMQWFNSPGHYKNMFSPESTKIGIGVANVEDSPFGYYWSMCTAY